jgi:hypothetical protein
MAWKFSVNGADTFDNDGEKVAFERHLVEEVRAFVARIAVKPSVQVEDGSVDVDTQDAVSLKPPSDSTPVPEDVVSDG